MPAPDDTATHTRAEHEIEQRALARGEANEAREVHWLPVHRSDK